MFFHEAWKCWRAACNVKAMPHKSCVQPTENTEDARPECRTFGHPMLLPLAYGLGK